MELGIFGIVGIILLVWYFGSTLNKVVAKVDHVIDNSAEMASDEFDMLRAEQRLRITKGYDELGKRISESKFTHGKSSVNDLLNALEKGTVNAQSNI